MNDRGYNIHTHAETRINAHVTRHRNNLSSKLHGYRRGTSTAAELHARPRCYYIYIFLPVRGGVSVVVVSQSAPWSVSESPVRAAVGLSRCRWSPAVMSDEPQPPRSLGSSSRHKIYSALQVIRKNAVYRSIVMRLGHAGDTPKKCKKTATAGAHHHSQAAVASVAATDDGGFGDWRTEGLPEHSHRRPSPPCAVSRSVSDYSVVQRSSGRKQHSSDTKRVEEAYRRGFCDGSVADVLLMRQTVAAQQQQQHQKQQSSIVGRRRRPSSMNFVDDVPWTRLSSSSTVPAGLGCSGVNDRVSSKSHVATTPTVTAATVVVHRSLPTSASRFQRHRRLSLPVSSVTGACSNYSSQNSIDMESPSATVPTKAAAIALHQLIECYRNGYRVTDHKIALMLDILDTQQRLAKVKVE